MTILFPQLPKIVREHHRTLTRKLPDARAQLKDESSAPGECLGELKSRPTPSPGEVEGMVDAASYALELLDGLLSDVTVSNLRTP